VARGIVAVPAGNAEEAALADSVEALAAATVGEFGHRRVLYLDDAHELPSTPPLGRPADLGCSTRRDGL
jgi:hypothetical protein